MIFFFTYTGARWSLCIGRTAKGAIFIITSYLNQFDFQFCNFSLQFNDVTVLLSYELCLLGKPFLLCFELFLQKKVRFLEYMKFCHICLGFGNTGVCFTVGQVFDNLHQSGRTTNGSDYCY